MDEPVAFSATARTTLLTPPDRACAVAGRRR
jgi:hypothetical protein